MEKFKLGLIGNWVCKNLIFSISLGDRNNKTNGRTPSAENLTNLDHLPPPPVYREATRLSKEDNTTTNIQENTTEKPMKQSKNVIADHHRNNGEPSISGSGVDEDVPPPIPPHRTPVDRPKSAMSIDQPIR